MRLFFILFTVSIFLTLTSVKATEFINDGDKTVIITTGSEEFELLPKGRRTIIDKKFTICKLDSDNYKGEEFLVECKDPQKKDSTLHLSTLNKIRARQIKSDLVQVSQTPLIDACYSQKDPAQALGLPRSRTSIVSNMHNTIKAPLVGQLEVLQEQAKLITKRPIIKGIDFQVAFQKIVEKSVPNQEKIEKYWRTIRGLSKQESIKYAEKTYPIFNNIYQKSEEICVRALSEVRKVLLPSALERSELKGYFAMLDAAVGKGIWEDYYYVLESNPLRYYTTRLLLKLAQNHKDLNS